jgi:hypothetical protein
MIMWLLMHKIQIESIYDKSKKGYWIHFVMISFSVQFV